MPRPQRCRRICGMPDHRRFGPEDAELQAAIRLSLDEYEAIRLMDREGLTHEQCAEVMQVSRTTVTEIYASARRKLADALVEGRALEIGGGQVKLCDRKARCGFGVCGNLGESDPSTQNQGGQQL